MPETALRQRGKQGEQQVESQVFYDVTPLDTGDRVTVEITETEVTRKISEEPDGKKIEVDDRKNSRKISYPSVKQRYSSPEDRPEAILEPLETAEATEVDVYPAFSGYIFVRPRIEIQAEVGELVPMRDAFDSDNGPSAPEIDLLEPGEDSGRIPELEEPESRTGRYDSGNNDYYPELSTPEIFPSMDYSLPRVVNSIESKLILEKQPEKGYTFEEVEYPEEETDSRNFKAQVTEEMLEEGTLKEAIEYLIETGEIQGAVMETPYYSENSGENFDKGWNTHPQIVDLEGFDIDIVEYRINGELAENHIGEEGIEPGDEINIEASEIYGAHGDYAPTRETYEEWTRRYGEEIWGEEWSDIDRHIYAALQEGRDLTGEIDFSGREHLLEALNPDEEIYSPGEAPFMNQYKARA